MTAITHLGPQAASGSQAAAASPHFEGKRNPTSFVTDRVGYQVRSYALIGRKRKSPGGGLFSTESFPSSIVGAEAFHFRVRDGNGWVNLALATEAYSHAYTPATASEPITIKN